MRDIKKIFITGITGFAGSHLAEYVVHNHPGVEVYGLVRCSSSKENLLHIRDKIHLLDGNLIDYNAIFYPLEQIKPDCIFHLAANTFVQYSFTNPISVLFDNGIGTINLLEATRFLKMTENYDPTVVIVSSSEVYGKVEEHELPITEKQILRPLSPYAVSKAYEDMLANQYWMSWQMKIIRSRAFSQTGPRRSPIFVASNFAKQIAEIELGLKEPVIEVGNLDSIRTFSDVRDVVKAYWLLAHKGEYGDVYNICGTEVVRIKELLELLLELSNCKNVHVEVKPERMRPSDVTLQIPTCEKFMKLTGWKPEISFTQTLLDLLNYWRHKLVSSD